LPSSSSEKHEDAYSDVDARRHVLPGGSGTDGASAHSVLEESVEPEPLRPNTSLCLEVAVSDF